jgi:mannitol/fructose-specific phosphotransferase system IIA component (Ntr-type)
MKIANLLKKENILLFSSPETKESIIEQLVNNLILSYKDENFSDELKKDFLVSVMEREKQSSTGIGSGIAFPHGRINGLNKPIIAMGIIKDGVDFSAIDKKDVNIIFLFLFPANRHDLGVKTQAVFARFLSNKDNISTIIESNDIDLIHKNIEEAKLAIDSPITAQDLMRKPKITLTEDMPLAEVTRLMDKFNTEVAPILDKNSDLIGEIDCIHLFQMELPDYIKELHSVPPIHDFNPFSKYFSEDSELKVSQVSNKDVAKVKLDASMLEIIFLLAVKKHSIVHVCENDKLVGVIDRITVIDKVFNF